MVVDRLVVRGEARSRLADSVETALRVCPAEVRVLSREEREGEWEERAFSTVYRNPATGFEMPPLSPGLFSFNAHSGACPACHGLGTEMFCDEDLIVRDRSRSLNEGAVDGIWKNAGRKGWNQRQIEAVGHYFKVDFDAPFEELPEDYKRALFYGTGEEEIEVEWEKDGRVIPWKKKYEGLCRQVERLHRETASESVKRTTGRFMRSQRCRRCGGARLKPEVLGVRLFSGRRGKGAGDP